jgi:hypothetical protein
VFTTTSNQHQRSQYKNFTVHFNRVLNFKKAIIILNIL